MVNDPVGDFLTRIRNAQVRHTETVEMPSTKMLVSLADILKKERFIEEFEVREDSPQNTLVLKLKYVNGEPAMRELTRVSKPGIRRYRGYKQIRRYKNGMGISIFTTPMGIISDSDAIKFKVGGEHICNIA